MDKKKITTYLTAALLILSALFYSGKLNDPQFNEQQLWVLLIGAVLMVAVNHFNPIIGFGLIYCVVQLAFWRQPNYINSMSQMMTHLLLYHWIAAHYRGDKYVWPMLAVMLVNLPVAFIQLAQQDVYWHVNLQPAGLMTLPLWIGMYAAICAPIFYRLHPFTLIPVLISLFLAHSSFCGIAFVISMAFYWWSTNHSKMLRFFLPAIILAVAMYAVFYDAPHGQFSRRFGIWQMVASNIAKNPWIGFGLGSYNSYIQFAELRSDKTAYYFNFRPVQENVPDLLKTMQDFGESLYGKEMTGFEKLGSMAAVKDWFQHKTPVVALYVWQDPHEEFLLLLFELGLVGLFFVLWYLWDLWERFEHLSWIQNRRIVALMASAIAILIISFAHFPFGVARISFLCVTILAILDSKLKGGQ